MHPSTSYAIRRERLKALMDSQGITALLVLHPANRFYLSGFELHDSQCNESSGALLICTHGPDWLLTDARYQDEATAWWPAEQVHIYTNPRITCIGEFIRNVHTGPVWVETQAMCADMYMQLSQALDLQPSPRLIEQLRVIKDDGEIAALRQSCALNHQVYDLLRPLLQPGITEQELAWELEKAFREQGAEALSFAPIVAFGPRAALPHATPGPQVLAPETPVLIDMGGRVQNYCSDQTRTWWAGSAPADTFTRTLELVQAAQELAIARVAPGVSTAELYDLAMNFFRAHDVGAYFTHSLGHGIGLETHEAPGVGPHRPSVLQPGMVITIEPGLYYPAWGGVRWEYMVLVTDNGHEVL